MSTACLQPEARTIIRALPYQGQTLVTRRPERVPGVRRAGSWEIREVQHRERSGEIELGLLVQLLIYSCKDQMS